MKKTAAVLVVLLSCWLVASVGLAQRCKDDEVPIITIQVGRESPGGPIVYQYPDKRPTICRNQYFRLHVEFLDDSVKGLELKEFISTFTKRKQWLQDTEDEFTLEIAVMRPAAGSFPRVVDTPKYQLCTAWFPPGLVKVRMILFTAELTLADGTKVSFDPPWGERP